MYNIMALLQFAAPHRNIHWMEQARFHSQKFISRDSHAQHTHTHTRSPNAHTDDALFRPFDGWMWLCAGFVWLCDGVCVVETDQAGRMCSSEREMEIEAVLAQMAAMILLTKNTAKWKIENCSLRVASIWFCFVVVERARLAASLLGTEKKILYIQPHTHSRRNR